MDPFYSKAIQGLLCLLTYHGNLCYGQRCQKGFLRSFIDAQLVIRLGLTSCHLRNRLVTRHSKRNGQACLFDDALSQLCTHFIAAKELIHTGEVGIELIDRGLLKTGHRFLNDLRNHIGVFRIGTRVTSNDEGIRTKFPCPFHRHGRVHAISACFVAAGGDHTTVACSSDQYGFIFQAIV